jgi:hypothetical protein
MLSPDYQEFANRGSPATRDNTVISGLGTGEVIEITPALLDCHEKQARKRNFLPVAGRKTRFYDAHASPKRERPDALRRSRGIFKGSPQ